MARLNCLLPISPSAWAQCFGAPGLRSASAPAAGARVRLIQAWPHSKNKSFLAVCYAAHEGPGQVVARKFIPLESILAFL